MLVLLNSWHRITDADLLADLVIGNPLCLAAGIPDSEHKIRYKGQPVLKFMYLQRQAMIKGLTALNSDSRAFIYIIELVEQPFQVMRIYFIQDFRLDDRQNMSLSRFNAVHSPAMLEHNARTTL